MKRGDAGRVVRGLAVAFKRLSTLAAGFVAPVIIEEPTQKMYMVMKLMIHQLTQRLQFITEQYEEVQQILVIL